MKSAQFIGREPEMGRLKGLLSKKSASLIVVRGRRRGCNGWTFFSKSKS